MKKIILFAFSLFVCSSLFARTCATHESCAVGTNCACTVTPSTAYDRYFYFDFSGFEPGKIYSCQFKSFPTSPMIDFDLSTFPKGATYQCKGDCPHFPLELTVDTQNMNTFDEKMSIKYLVFATDYPSEVSAQCVVKKS